MDIDMKILLTGANGYVGTRLLQVLAKEGHHIVALARSPSSVFIPKSISSQVEVIQGDLLKEISIPSDIDAAYYLVHSMSLHLKDFDEKDKLAARNFTNALNKTKCKQLIYLTGLITTTHLSKHLASRLEVENILKSGEIPVTTLRAGIVIGSGSASFEIIRDLVEKLPIMVAPKWVNTKCQPIAIRDALFYLSKVLGHSDCIGKTFDIGGPDVLTYKQMLYQFAKVRKLHRLIIPVPVLTPKLSSLWLILVTSTNYFLARSLVDSMMVNATCTENAIQSIFPRKCLGYAEAVKKALHALEENSVISSWKDSWTTTSLDPSMFEDIKTPEFGCYKEKVSQALSSDPDEVFKTIMDIGGKTGYFSMNWAWRVRGLIDTLLGGVGIHRGRTHKKTLKVGDVIDFWRVIYLNKEERHMILFAEMKIPGEAFLEFDVSKSEVIQTATFCPKGVFGRAYWWVLYPIHKILFPRMLSALLEKTKR